MKLFRVPVRLKHALAMMLVLVLLLTGTAAVFAMKPAYSASTVVESKKTAALVTHKTVSATPSTSPAQLTPSTQLAKTSQKAVSQPSTATIAKSAIVTPVATTTPQPSPVAPQQQQGFSVSVDLSQVSSTSTGYYFPYQITRTGGFTGTVTPDSVTVSPQGAWPNYIDVEEIFPLTPDTGAFILIPEMNNPTDVTITVTLSGYPNNSAYEASYSFQYQFPSYY